MSFRPNVSAWGMIRVVPQWGIRHSRKRGGVLTRAVRGTGIPSAVRVRFLIEANSGLQQKQYPLCRPRLRKTLPSRNLNHHIARLERFALLVSVDSFGSLLPYSKCPTGAPLPSLPPSMFHISGSPVRCPGRNATKNQNHR